MVGVQLDNFSISAGRLLIAPVSLELECGKVYGLTGENGSGKTSFLRALAGLHAYQGSLRLMGREVKSMHPAERARKVSVVFTARNRSGELTAEDALYTAQIPWIDQQADSFQAILQQTIQLFQLQDLLKKFLYQLSDGEYQKVMMARAFAQNTPVILMDEPAAFLDFKNRSLMYRWIQTICREEGRMVIFSSHELEQLALVCDEVLNISDTVLEARNPEGKPSN